MRKYIIEREIPGIGESTREALREGARTSQQVLSELGPGIQWQHSYVTGDKYFCVFLAEDEALIREHAERAGVPASRINEVHAVSDPTVGRG